MTATIRLYNTLTRAKGPLRTELPDRVTLYVCGPTVYNFAHIGNARPAVIFDVLARLLRHDYPEIVYARNFTDVDDKINAAAAEAGCRLAPSPSAISTPTMRICRRWACCRRQQAAGYVEVNSPDIMDRSLWEISGHWH